MRVGYVIENPIWKTSYRLVLSPKGEEKPYLQGWAVVENPSDEDWRDVRMVLVSGRPISFQMDLYTPLYVQRPTVVPELFQGLRPVAYSGSMDEARAWPRTATNATMLEALNDADEPDDRMPPERRPRDATARRQRTSRRRHRDGLRPSENDARQARTLNLGRSVSSAATAAKLGDFFQYAIDRPVSLQRQKSALLPIIGKDVEAVPRLHLQRGGPGQVPAAGPALQEHVRARTSCRGRSPSSRAAPTPATPASWTSSPARSASSATPWTSAPRSTPSPSQRERPHPDASRRSRASSRRG